MKKPYLLNNQKKRQKFRWEVGITVMIWALCLTITTVTAQTITTSATTNQYSLQAPAIVVDNSITLTSATSITDARVTVSSNFSSGDVLSYTGTLPSGVTASYDAATGVLAFTGTAAAADWQALLRTVIFSSSSSSTAARAIVFSLGNLVSATNGHFYEFVPFGPLSTDILTWHLAKAAAAARTYFGLQGYLATITSQEENDVIHQKLSASGWIGSTDNFTEIKAATGSSFNNQNQTEGKWYWVTGPEAGTQFSQSASDGAIPTAVNGMYMNWSPISQYNSEPNNNWGTTANGEKGEQYGEIYSGTSIWGQPGKWNDFYSINMDRDFVQGYVVEYGGFANDPVDISAYRTLNIADAVLPVTGLQFSASEAGAAVLLKWSTYTETSNSHFEIQRSADGRNFQKIGSYKAPEGNSISTRNYQFTDYNPVEGANYYRLKQYDLDGHFTFSDILRFDLQKQSRNSWTAYPNTLQKGGHITLTILSIIAQKAHLVLSSSAGQRVSGTYLSLHKGTTTYSFNVVNLPAGTYYLALYQTGGAMITEVKKIQIR
jgi:hypothetical protein